MAEAKPVALIMAGGSGTRFWPLSQKNLPKQYLKLVGEKSLIQETVERAKMLVDTKDIFICSGQSQKKLLEEQLPEVSGLILEPEGRNTLPCLMLSVDYLLRQGYDPETPLMVFPADHHVGNTNAFKETLLSAVEFAKTQNALVTLGIVPSSPHTGYGYIEAGTEEVQPGVFSAERFLEKPSLEKAQEFVKSLSFYWNSGIFIWTLKTISEAFEKFQGEAWNRIKACESIEAISKIYSSLPALPIDTSIMEKAENVFLIPAPSLEWTDLGSWNALYELKSTNQTDNTAISGQVKAVDSTGCLVNVAPGTKVALVGVTDLVVVEKDGVILIASRSKDQLVREVSKSFETTT